VIPEQIELARALVGLDGFVWSAGMRGCHGQMSGADNYGSDEGRVPEIARGSVYAPAYVFRWLPDLTDAATGGILLDALGSGAKASCGEIQWVVIYYGDGPWFGPTLAHACAAALVARGWYRRTG